MKHLYKAICGALLVIGLANIVPTPAAASSGVVLAKFGIKGSAPSPTSRRINGTSPRSAANSSGVAPSDPILEDVAGTFGVPFGRRKLTFAPRFTISRTKSALDSLPDPVGGAGSLPSLESGFRTPASA